MVGLGQGEQLLTQVGLFVSPLAQVGGAEEQAHFLPPQANRLRRPMATVPRDDAGRRH
jgi:ribosomal protein S15P/S13E